MRRCQRHPALTWFLTALLLGAACSGVGAESPAYGGILTFVVPAEPPSFDGHRENTFALIHPIAPFYSTLIRVNPHNPGAADDFVGDLALEVPEPTRDGTVYTFRLREDAEFADGQPVTAHDVAASFNKIIFPPDGVASARQAFFSMVDRLYASNASSVVFELRYPSAAFLPAPGEPVQLHLQRREAGAGRPLVRTQRPRVRSVRIRRTPARRLHHRQAKPPLPPRRAALS